jgi:hypothetical protein
VLARVVAAITETRVFYFCIYLYLSSFLYFNYTWITCAKVYTVINFSFLYIDENTKIHKTTKKKRKEREKYMKKNTKKKDSEVPHQQTHHNRSIPYNEMYWQMFTNTLCRQ